MKLEMEKCEIEQSRAEQINSQDISVRRLNWYNERILEGQKQFHNFMASIDMRKHSWSNAHTHAGTH